MAEITLECSSARGKLRTIQAARHQARQAPTIPRRTVRIAAVVVVLLVALSFTPPGKSVAEAVGELVGIGDDPSGKGLELFGSPPSSEVVIGVGNAPNDVGYELVRSSQGDDSAIHRQTCYYVSFPELSHPPDSASCLTRAALRGLRRQPVSFFAHRGPGALGPEGAVVVTGATTDRVASLEVSYPAQDGSPQRAAPELYPFIARPSIPSRQRLDQPRTAEQARIRTKLNAFVVFLPFDLEPRVTNDLSGVEALENAQDVALGYQRQLDRIVVTARDGEGRNLTETPLGTVSNLALGLALG